MAKIPSIALIPSGYKATKIYSVLPVDGSADLTFDRGTSDDQTRVNSNGLIEDVAVDVPRLDYFDGGCPSLLLEPATTNSITYSEDFTDASWAKDVGGVASAPTVTANQGVSPKGDLTADRVEFDLNGGTTSSDISQLTFNLTPATTTYTNSFYAKSFNGSSYDFSFLDAEGVLTVITITSEWQRFSVTNAGGLTSTNVFRLRLRGSESTSDNADILIWGAQIEEQSYATSYVPSLGTSGVRATETASKTGLSSYINSSEGVIYAEISALADNLSFRVISLSDNGTSDRVVFGFNNSTNEVYTFLDSAGSPQGSISTKVVDITDFSKVAILYSENNRKFYVNGLLVGTDTTATMPIGLNTLTFSSGTGGSPFYGKVKELKVYKEAFSDLELATLTGFSSFAEMRDYLNYTAE